VPAPFVDIVRLSAERTALPVGHISLLAMQDATTEQFLGLFEGDFSRAEGASASCLPRLSVPRIAFVNKASLNTFAQAARLSILIWFGLSFPLGTHSEG